MLNVLFAYKTLDDLEQTSLSHDEVVKVLAENMVFITRDFSNDLGLTTFGQELMSDYFGRVPESNRAAVFIEYINQLNASGEDFNIEMIIHQAAS